MKKDQQYSATVQALKNKEERSLLLKKKLDENKKRLKEKMKTYTH